MREDKYFLIYAFAFILLIFLKKYIAVYEYCYKSD